MTTNLLLINPLALSRASYFPFGPLYIASYLELRGQKVLFFDRNATLFQNKNSLHYLNTLMIQFINNNKPQYIGFSMMTGHFFDVYFCSRLIKKHFPKIKILLGGIHPTFEPHRTLEQLPDTDILVRGPGELPTEQILAGKPLGSIPNLVFRDNNKLFSNSIEKTARREELFPKYELMDHHFYWKTKRYHTNSLHIPDLAMIMTSQGCPGQCTFCVDDRFLGSGFFHPNEHIFREMDFLMDEYSIKTFFFVDRDFRLSGTGALKFALDKIKSGRGHIPWTTSLRADQISSELATALHESTCIRVVLGIESGSQKILDYLNKNITVEQNAEAIQILNDHKILPTGSFIYGVPTQTEEDLKANISFFRQTKLFDSGVLNLMPGVGSKIFDDLVKNGRLNPDDMYTWNQISSGQFQPRKDRNYSNIPYPKYKKIYDAHANEIFHTCKARRISSLKEYNLIQYFDTEQL